MLAKGLAAAAKAAAAAAAQTIIAQVSSVVYNHAATSLFCAVWKAGTAKGEERVVAGAAEVSQVLQEHFCCWRC